MDLALLVRRILVAQVTLPPVLTLILLVLKVVHMLNLTWTMAFLPLILSSSIGFVLAVSIVAIAYIFGRE